jgi:hypothetical protein
VLAYWGSHRLWTETTLCVVLYVIRLFVVVLFAVHLFIAAVHSIDRSLSCSRLLCGCHVAVSDVAPIFIIRKGRGRRARASLPRLAQTLDSDDIVRRRCRPPRWHGCCGWHGHIVASVSHCCVRWTGGVALSLVCWAGGDIVVRLLGWWCGSPSVILASSHPQVLASSSSHLRVLASIGLVAWLVVVAVCSGWGQTKEW